MKTKRKINAIKWNNNQGFTLVEIMVATAISLLIITSVYSAFRSSLSAYERNQTKVIMLQKVRMSLDRMARDFSNLYYDADDEELTFLSEDAFDSELNVDQDMISFVAVVNPKLNDYLQKQQSNQSTDEEESENALPSDLARVIYFIGQDPDNQDMQSLMRIEMTELSTEELETLLDEIQSTSPTEEIKDMLRRSTLVDNIGGFNIRYFDGEDWVDKWDIDEEENIPKAVELTLTVADPDNKQKPITQAVVVYLPFSENKTEQGQGIASQQSAGQNQNMIPMQ